MTFPCYPKYKASGFLWLGDVPEHWALKRLGHYFEERRERASDTEFEPLSVTKYGIVPRLESAAKTQDGDNRKKVLAGDFVINSRSDRKGSSGLSPLDGSVSLICTVLIPTGLHGPYIHHLFRSELFQEEYYRWGKGIVADLWSTNFSDMKNIVLGVPSEAEQTQIARFLDHETVRIDALIEEQQRLIELLKEKRQAVISHAVTKGLDPTVPMKDSGVEWLGEVPEHWRVIKLGLLASDRCDGPFGSALKSEHYTDEGVRVIRLQNIKSGWFNDADSAFIDAGYYRENIGKSDVVAGDVLIAGLGDDNNPVGRACVAPENIAPAMVKADCFRFRLMPDVAASEFIALQLTAGATADAGILSTGSTRARIPLSSMSTRLIALPPVSEQKSIVSFIQRLNENIDSLFSEAQSGIALLQERRSALISAAVTGKIDVRGWQPPASTQAPELAVAEAV